MLLRHVAIIEKGNTFIHCYLPGVSADDTDIQVTQGSVSISGLRRAHELADGERSLYSDIAYGQFRRFIKLPAKIQNTKGEASFENGVLTLRLPKVGEEQNKVVKISLGNVNQQIKASNETVEVIAS